MLTGLLIALLVAGGAIAVGGLALSAKRRRSLSGTDDTPLLPAGDADGGLLERSVHDLRVGDVIQHDARDWLVEGVVAYDEDGHRWCAGRLVDGKDALWLVAGMERLVSKGSIRLLSTDPEMEISGYPPETLVREEVRFNLDTRGTASAKFKGDVGKLPGKRGDPALDTVERCRWWRYESAGDDTLIIEQWSGEYRALRGKRVSIEVIEMIPGS
jgi:hypothetical protein